MELQKANTDTTYCTNEKCNKCWRHISKYKFDDKNYWFMECCEEMEE